MNTTLFSRVRTSLRTLRTFRTLERLLFWLYFGTFMAFGAWIAVLSHNSQWTLASTILSVVFVAAATITWRVRKHYLSIPDFE